MESGLVGLRAELHKKRVEASKYGAGQKGLPRRDTDKQYKKSTSFHSSNAGVSARADKDKEQLEKETLTEEKARSILEEKAAMYERLHGGVEALEDDALNQKYLINFQKKIVDEVLERKKLRTVEKNRSKNQREQEESNSDDYKASKDDEEWVEYTDAFGRTRECMKKDLPAMLEQDQELARDLNQDDTSGSLDLLSEDMRREIQRQKWEREEELNALKKDLHYQDVLYDEARAHGAGFMKFSRDENKRKEQMDLLKELRTETQRAEAAKVNAASKKQKLMQVRLEKVRQRKRLKMGLPMRENDKLKTPPASDDEEGNDGVIGPTAPSGVLEDTSVGSGIHEMEPKAKKPHVREWDLGKEGVTSILSQEEWVDRQRKQRNNEFAPPSMYDSHKKAGYVSACSILQASETELQQKIGIASIDAEQLMATVASYVLPKQLSVWEMSNSSTGKLTYVTTGCPQLDDFLGGGVPVRGITEVTGESGSGKTQLALQLALHAQLSLCNGGLGKGVAYICTECQFPAVRLQQLIYHLQEKCTQGPKSFTDNIFIHHVSDMDSLVDCVRYQLPHLIPSRQVGLVIIDSVAATFRAEDGAEVNKAAPLQTLGYRLHQLASSYGVAVVAINQVTAAMGKQSLYGHTGNVTPALGLSWANLVTTRLMLTRTNSYVRVHKTMHSNKNKDKCSKWGANNASEIEGNSCNRTTTAECNVRLLEVVFCPWLAQRSCSFVVTEKGIEDVTLSTPDLYSSFAV